MAINESLCTKADVCGVENRKLHSSKIIFKRSTAILEIVWFETFKQSNVIILGTPEIKPVEYWLLFNLAYPFAVIVVNIALQVFSPSTFYLKLISFIQGY